MAKSLEQIMAQIPQERQNQIEVRVKELMAEQLKEGYKLLDGG